MFTGIIKDVGRIMAMKPQADPIYIIATQLPLADVQLGASIACNGVCLTVIAFDAGQFQVQVSAETLAKTTAARWRVGMPVNLECALRLGDELGGHLVSGHVDGVLTITAREPEGESLRFRFTLPESLRRFLAPKGSITLDGVSLTVNEVLAAEFGVNIIPHTQRWTNFSVLKPGDQINCEVDMLARYVDRILAQRGV